MSNSINQKTCIKCKLCIDVCPVKAIDIDKNNNINFVKERESICLLCGQCMSVCPTEAITLKNYSYKENFQPIPNDIINYQQFMDFIKTRRSIRNFTNKKVEKHTLIKIIDSLKYAPYGDEPKAVEITIINNRNKIVSILPLIEEFLNNIIKWVDNPIISSIIKTKKGSETYSTLKKHLYPMIKLDNYNLNHDDRITRGAPTLIILHGRKEASEHTHNSLIYATYLMFAIHSLGLGSTINGIIPAAINKEKKIKEKFNIPKDHEAIISIMLGYPKYKYKKTIDRKDKKINWVD